MRWKEFQSSDEARKACMRGYISLSKLKRNMLDLDCRDQLTSATKSLGMISIMYNYLHRLSMMILIKRNWHMVNTQLHPELGN